MSEAGELPAAPMPRAASESDISSLRDDLRRLAASRLFWAGLALKVAAALLFGSHFATRWFAPFLYEFVHSHFRNPWQAFLTRGEPLAFPNGPGMLLVAATSWLPALAASFDPSSHFGLLLLRLPLLVADLAIFLLLLRWLRVDIKNVLVAYWLNPIVFYASYVHGQLDLIPTAILCAALFLVFTKRVTLGALVFGFAIATKLHLLIAAPLAAIYLFRLPGQHRAWLKFSLLVCATAAALYAIPASSAAFRTMVFGTAEAQKLWLATVSYSKGAPVLYLALAALMVGLMRFACYRKINRELTLMFLGALYLTLLALVPPGPGWFIWSVPFVAYLGARFSRVGGLILLGLSCAYLLYFFVSDPTVFLESLDPSFGPGFGAALAGKLALLLPGVFGAHGASIAWTLLFSTTVLAAYEMYRRGVQSNFIYGFRDESFMLAICGDSGAGKHTIGRDLALLLGSQISLIDGDDDHKWERGHRMWQRFSHLNPRGNRLDVQVEGLAALRGGGEIRRRRYDHEKGQFTAPVRVRPNDFIGLVGLHPLYLASQRALFHLKVFVDPHEELRREWKIARDMAGRGYTRERVLEQMAERAEDSSQFVRPQMVHADLVVRHLPREMPEVSSVAVEFELANQLESHLLIDALESVSGLKVEWRPETEPRDRVVFTGEIGPGELRAAADRLIPNLDELVEQDGWLPGGRGLVQLVLLHSVSSQLRAGRRLPELERP
jgi:uridine kinase